MATRKAIPAAIKQAVALEQVCANRPHAPAPGCREYVCPQWKCNMGKFDESGYEIDHIVEVKHGGTNDIENLQALCPCCHAVKTRRCAKQKWTFDSHEIDFGRANMDMDPPPAKRTKRALSNLN